VKKLPNPRRVKIHRNYTVEEVAQVCHVHKGTVRNWTKNGLETIDCNRPTLVLGAVLRAFLETKRTKNKQKLKPGEIYCVRCRKGICPLGDFAELQRVGGAGWRLVGFCPSCESEVFRLVSVVRLCAAIGNLNVTIPEALKRLVNGSSPFVNSDFR